METVWVTSRLKLPNFMFQLKQMMVADMWSNYPHGFSKTEEIFIIPTTWPSRTVDLVSNIRQRSWTNKERICWWANVDIKFKWRHTTVSWMKLNMNSLVASDFTEVKMLPNICCLWDWNFIGNAPDFFLYSQPKTAIYHKYNYWYMYKLNKWNLMLAVAMHYRTSSDKVIYRKFIYKKRFGQM